jgi:hypothetical protein
MKTAWLVMLAAALLGQTALSMAGEDVTSSLVPTDDGRGVAACVSVSFGNLRELPVKAVKGLWSLVVCVTQPIHPYHYVRDDQRKVVTDSNGHNKKVWLPFYRLWGEHQSDSVVGIVYDNHGTNGIAGSCWFAGYGNSGWQDKGGKLAGLALLTWGAREAFQSQHHEHGDRDAVIHPVEIAEHGDDRAAPPPARPEPELQPQPQPEPIPEPTLPEGWEGDGGPVGR